MANMILTDLRKMFGNYQIYLSMLSLSVVYTLTFVEQLRSNKFMGDFTNGFQMILVSDTMIYIFLICIVGGSFMYCAEEKYGYFKFEIQRVGVHAFTVGKLLTSLIGGFLTSIIGIFGSIGAVIVFSYISYANKAAIWPSAEQLENMIWSVLLLALLCGLLSTMGFLVTTFCANYYIGMAAPIILYYVLLLLLKWFHVPQMFQISYVYLEGGAMSEGYLSYFIYAVMYTACLQIIFYRIAKWRIKRRLECV